LLVQHCPYVFNTAPPPFNPGARGSGGSSRARGPAADRGQRNETGLPVPQRV